MVKEGKRIDFKDRDRETERKEKQTETRKSHIYSLIIHLLST